MLCMRTLGRVPVCRKPTVHTQSSMRNLRVEASKNALVVGGGFSGLSAAQVLTDAGMNVVLVEQGRGLGGRMCTRTVTLGSHGEKLTFDHGCQYLTPRNPLFETALDGLSREGAVAQWGKGRPVGVALLAEDGTVDTSTFAADTQKALWVGNPTNSAVGRALATRAGPRLTALTATRVEALSWDPATRTWACQANPLRAGTSDDAAEPIARLNATSFDMVVTAMSSHSTVKLLEASTTPGGAGGSVAPEVVAAASAVHANVCWALMVAVNKIIDVPYDGVLLSRPGSPGGVPEYGPIAWVARDSSKPGRPAVAGGAGEAWVVHGGPEWSNARRNSAPADVAAELLRDFAHLVQTPISAADVIHLEAFRWSNAYPLNPRYPQPVAAAQGQPELPGHFMLRPDLKLGVCGDWCKGPRAADSYVSGWEAAQALLQL